MTEDESIPPEYRGWWRITETSQWSSKFLDSLGPALLSLTGYADRLRMHCLLAYVNCKPTKLGVSFTWEGAWEFDPVSGSGRARMGVSRASSESRTETRARLSLSALPSRRSPSPSHQATETSGSDGEVRSEPRHGSPLKKPRSLERLATLGDALEAARAMVDGEPE